jgi:IMP dehydrogenase/GMP reductase
MNLIDIFKSEAPRPLKVEDFTSYQANKDLLIGPVYLTINDVLLKPQKGILASRSDVEEHRSIFTAPMDTVTDINIYRKAIRTTSTIPVLSRVYFSEFTQLFNKENLSDYNNHPSYRLLLEKGFISIGSAPSDIDLLEDFIDTLNAAEIHYGFITSLNVCIDIAHGYSERGLAAIEKIRKLIGWSASLMTGSICTKEAASECISAGADYLRVGIGGGRMCSTRLQTACGSPNLSAVMEIFSSLENHEIKANINGNFIINREIKIIADGGVRDPGDIVRYLAAGADGVMIGTAFADCYDSPAKIDSDGNKIHRGQASYEYQLEVNGLLRNDCAEGVTRKLPPSTIDFITRTKEFAGGIRSAVSYLGLTSTREINPINCSFIRCTPTIYMENKPQD